MTLTEGFENIVRENVPLSPFTSLKLGGNAAYFAEPGSCDELVSLVQRFKNAEQPIRLLGSGSNILIPDAGVEGLVIRLTSPEFCGIQTDGNQLTVGGGTPLAQAISASVREGLSGLHNLVGIPGSVGGALHGNAGVHGFDIGSLVDSVSVLTRDGEIEKREKDAMAFAHRSSSLNELVILSATFQLEKNDPERLTKSMQQKWIVSRANLPFSEERSAYIFKDHGGESAAEVIERSGLKGTSLGPVSLSDRNSNCLIAGENSTAADVLKFVEHIEDQVAIKSNVELESALQVW